MNNEIQVEEYIRTKQGYIAKVIDVDNDNTLFCDGTIIYDYEKYDLLWDYQRNKIKKHSFNIIDLIEVRRLCEW